MTKKKKWRFPISANSRTYTRAQILKTDSQSRYAYTVIRTTHHKFLTRYALPVFVLRVYFFRFRLSPILLYEAVLVNKKNTKIKSYDDHMLFLTGMKMRSSFNSFDSFFFFSDFSYYIRFESHLRYRITFKMFITNEMWYEWKRWFEVKFMRTGRMDND